MKCKSFKVVGEPAAVDYVITKVGEEIKKCTQGSTRKRKSHKVPKFYNNPILIKGRNFGLDDDSGSDYADTDNDED